MTDTIARLEKGTTAAPAPPASTPVGANAQAQDHDTLARLMQAGVLRPELKIGGASDPEERDADCMADRAIGGGGACCDSCAKDASETIRMKPIGSDSIPISTANSTSSENSKDARPGKKPQSQTISNVTRVLPRRCRGA
jgi:hypothetical protein